MPRKGQGALEYLLILAAILAIAVVVILVAHHVSTPARESALINQDRYSCAQTGIELVNYNKLPTSAGQVLIKYKGKTYQCVGASGYYLSESIKMDAGCKIHFASGKEVDLYVGEANKCGATIGGSGCGISNKQTYGCFIGEFSSPGSGGLPPIHDLT